MGVTDGKVVGATQILNNAPRATAFTIVILSDGYQAGQLGQFSNT